MTSKVLGSIYLSSVSSKPATAPKNRVCRTRGTQPAARKVQSVGFAQKYSTFNHTVQCFKTKHRSVFSRSTSTVQMSDQPTVLVPMGNGSEEMETSVMVDVLRRAGAQVTLASVEDDLVCTMSRNMKFVADCLISECADNTYTLVALPGGMPGAERLRDCAVLQEILKKQASASQPYAAMCASPAVVLAEQGLLEGKQATAHPAFVEKIQGSSQEGRVVVDGNLVTSRGPGTAIEFALAMVELLFDKEKAKEVAGPMVIPPTEKAPLVPNEWSL